MSERLDCLTSRVAAERTRTLDFSDKAVQPSWYGCTAAEVATAHPTLDELSTPMMTLDRRAIDANLAAMARWCAEAGVSLAPHGKTTMAPSLWREQLIAGSWAITVANEPQLRVARAAGVPRVIVANLFLRPAGLKWLVSEMNADAEFDFMCWVDSVKSVRIMEAALAEASPSRHVPVLIELGGAQARTGARTVRAALRVAEAVIESPSLSLAGVAGFEGAVPHGLDDQAIVEVDEFLGQFVKLHRALIDRYEVPEPILSAGGSIYFDRVAAILGPEGAPTTPKPARVVLRSGAYIVHDDGLYRELSPSTRGAGPTFEPAMNVWARVISMPESGLAYLDAGKRDVPYDAGLPEVQLLRRVGPDGEIVSLPLVDHDLFETNDQHSFVHVPPGSPLRVGDVVRLGLSHPCTAFDKWSLIPVLDAASAATPVVVDFVRTHF
jgi:D-serine deaminase-like pyridoxal phosphate-dependent protein